MTKTSTKTINILLKKKLSSNKNIINSIFDPLNDRNTELPNKK